MDETQDSTISKEEFLAYERLRESGLTNMFSSQVPSFVGITKDQNHYIMTNYRGLCKIYLPERYAKLIAGRG